MSREFAATNPIGPSRKSLTRNGSTSRRSVGRSSRTPRGGHPCDERGYATSDGIRALHSAGVFWIATKVTSSSAAPASARARA